MAPILLTHTGYTVPYLQREGARPNDSTDLYGRCSERAARARRLPAADASGDNVHAAELDHRGRASDPTGFVVVDDHDHGTERGQEHDDLDNDDPAKLEHARDDFFDHDFVAIGSGTVVNYDDDNPKIGQASLT